MYNKRPKITVTESNKMYVIPTLEKLGGKLRAIEHKAFLFIDMIFYIDGWGDIDGRNKNNFEKLNGSREYYYEVDPKDYIMDESELTELNKLRGCLSDCLQILEQTKVHRQNLNLQGGDVFLDATINNIKELLNK
jgi:hypothetical protein